MVTIKVIVGTRNRMVYVYDIRKMSTPEQSRESPLKVKLLFERVEKIVLYISVSEVTHFPRPQKPTALLKYYLYKLRFLLLHLL